MTTDQSRARALALALVGPEGLTEDVVAGVELVLAAVRLEEQRAITAYLRRMAGRTSVGALPIRALADRIERGHHEETTR